MVDPVNLIHFSYFFLSTSDIKRSRREAQDIPGVLYGDSQRHKISTIQYLHHTVRDNVERADIWDTLLMKTANSNFEPEIYLLQSCILQIKVLPEDHSIRPIAATAVKYALSAKKLRPDYAALLDQLDITMS